MKKVSRFWGVFIGGKWREKWANFGAKNSLVFWVENGEFCYSIINDLRITLLLTNPRERLKIITMSSEILALAKGTKVWIVFPFCKKEYEKHILKNDCVIKGRYISTTLEEAQKGNIICEAYLTKKEAATARLIIRLGEMEALKRQMVDLSLMVADKHRIISKLGKEST